MYDLPLDGVVDIVEGARHLRDATADLRPGGPVAVTYHPLTYAWAAHEAYLRRYGTGRKKAILLGMNPGPWGMGQTGIPFGDIVFARDWLGLEGTRIEQPVEPHPKRPVLGWACKRREESGKRLWGELKAIWGTPDRALRDLIVVNHCPLLMFNEAGQNVTPDKLRRDDRDEMSKRCDQGVVDIIKAIAPRTLIGVGKYAEACCQRVADRYDGDLQVMSILHPSPASPLANQDGGNHWRENVHATFRAAGLL